MAAPVLGAQQTDILFVIDNSNSMKEEQEAVATELPAFLSALEAGGGIEQDFRVAVITTSVYQQGRLADGGVHFSDYTRFGQAGRLQAVPPPLADGGTGTAPGGERFLVGTDPDLLEKFRRLVKVGTTGSGQETPFEAVRLALTPPLSETAVDAGGTDGFLRDGARLLVVVVSDEDDCSESTADGGRPQIVLESATDVDWCREQGEHLTPTERYFEFLSEVRDSTGARRDLVWAAIAPVGRTTKEAAPVIDNGVLRNVDCPTSFQPGYRHREMAGLFDADLENLDSICNPSFHDSLLVIAGIASLAGTVEIMNVPDPALLVVELTRADGFVERCSVSNGGIRFEPGEGDRSARIHFIGECARRVGDQRIEVKLLCAG